MTTQTLDEIVETLSNLKVAELAKLKKMLEDKWGVTAAAPVAMAAPAATAAPAEAAAESTEFQVTLEAVSADKGADCRHENHFDQQPRTAFHNCPRGRAGRGENGVPGRNGLHSVAQSVFD